MDSYNAKSYPTPSQAGFLAQEALHNDHFSPRYDYSMACSYYHPAPCSFSSYSMPPTTQQNFNGGLEQFRQYFRSAHSIPSGPCIEPRLLETSSSHPDSSSLFSSRDAGPSASASELDSPIRDNNYTQNSTTSSGAHVYVHDNATIFQASGLSRPVDPPSRPKRKHTKISGATLPPTKATHLSKGGKKRKKAKNFEFKCTLCSNFSTKSGGDLKRHLESLAHKKPSYICKGCGSKFTRADALKRHTLHTCPVSRK